MAETERNGKTDQVSMQMSSFSRDLLHRFSSGNNFPGKFEGKIHVDYEKEEEGEGEIELSLGLSSNGRFGVDPQRANKLMRSSSISNFMMTSTDEKNMGCIVPISEYTPLTRTCSLPVETEEEWRKRKELQSLRRMEAKRKRLEKMKNVRVVRAKGDFEENCVENEKFNGNGDFLGSFKVVNWVNGGVGGVKNGHGGESSGELKPSSQGSIGSQGSGSSGISDFGSQPIQADITGTNKYTEERRLVKVQSLPLQIEQKSAAIPGITADKPGKFSGAGSGNTSTKVAVADQMEPKELARNMMVDMPCVTTKGDGPNGKRIEGFLYRYRKGEEVRIVCVCHGSFLSPAEFVTHAGGGDVMHPLKHIVVNPSPFL